MDEISNRAAEIELYADMVKIGIPAITGLLGAFIGGLATLLIERSRINSAEKREQKEFHRQQIVNLLNDLSEFSGKLSIYISLLLSGKFNSGEAFDSKVTESGLEMLSKQVNLNKAKAVIYVLNHPNIIECLEAYDEQAKITIDTILHPSNLNLEVTIKTLKTKEKELFNSLKTLHNTIASPL